MMNEIWSNTQTSIAVSVVLILLSGLCSGLALGILSLDIIDIEIIKRSGSQLDKRRAIQIEPLLRHPHHVLVTLLLCNTACTEALPIFLNNFLSPLQSILISVSAMLAFGEIIPQALCKRYGLMIGAFFAWPVKISMVLTFPVSWPISKILDYFLSDTTALFRRAELQALVTLHGESTDVDAMERGHHPASRKVSMLTAEEVQVIHGALDMAHKTAETAMTPLEHVFMISSEDTLDKTLLQRIIDCGHSRIPVVFEQKPSSMTTIATSTNIRGILLVKELLLLDTSKESIKVKDCKKIREIDFILSSTPLYAVLDLLRCKCRHMAVVVKENSNTTSPSTNLNTPITNIHHVQQHPIGIITIEDVLEELLQHEIVDETDKWVDNMKTQGVPPLVTPNGTSLSVSVPSNLIGWIAKRRKSIVYSSSGGIDGGVNSPRVKYKNNTTMNSSSNNGQQSPLLDSM